MSFLMEIGRIPELATFGWASGGRGGCANNLVVALSASLMRALALIKFLKSGSRGQLKSWCGGAEFGAMASGWLAIGNIPLRQLCAFSQVVVEFERLFV